MRKRISLLITLFLSTFVCVPSVFAVNYYENVRVRTEFSEEIVLTNIDSIEIYLEDATEYSKDYLLEKDKNFELTIENVPVGPYNLRYGVVNNDEIGYYRVSATVNVDEATNSLDVLINVSLQNNIKTDTTLTQEDIDRISGTTEPTTKDQSSGIIVEDDEDDETDNEANEDTNVTSKDIEQAREKEKQEEKKRKNRKRNSIIGKVMFSIIGLVFLSIIIYAAIKISRANK